MRGRSRRHFWLAALLGWVLPPLAAIACGDEAADEGSDSAGAGGGSNDDSVGSGGLGGQRGDGDGGASGGARPGGGGSGGRSGSGGADALDACVDDIIDDSCEVAIRTAVDGWNCVLRFPRDSLSAADGASVRVFVGCDEAGGMGGSAGSGGLGLWTFDHRTDTLRLGREVCESAADGTVLTAIAACD